MVNQNWAFVAIRNNFSGHIFIGLADAADIKISRMLEYGGRIRLDTVLSALKWRRKMADVGFNSVDAFPGDNGEILVSGMEREFELEIIVEDNRTFTASLSCGDTVLREASCGSFDAADSVLKEAAVRIWTLSGGLKVTSSTGERCVSQVSHFVNPPAMVAFP